MAFHVRESRGFVLVVLAAGLTAGSTLPALAADHFLTIGGGYSPTGNQVSLEKNVTFFRQTLGDVQLGLAPHDVFFSDGEDPARDVQYLDEGQPLPVVNAVLAQVLGEAKGLGFQYRSHQLPAVRGATSPENLDRWFREEGARLQAGDRLVIYLTGHGNKGEQEQNPHFYMWNRRQVTVKELTERLDRLPAGVQVVLVMVQCYSGGFANVIFNQGDPAQGVTAADRCGFYATVHNRPAAGCTPDIREEDYQEYSTGFWAALGGKTRTGRFVPAPDFNGDGRVSFAEAHAHVQIDSDTIDIPIKTSDAFLRSASKLPPPGQEDLLAADAPYETLSAAASPLDRVVLDGLSTQLGFTGADRARQARERADHLKKRQDELEAERRKHAGEADGLRKPMAAMLMLRWPELESRWHPRLAEIVTTEGPAIVAAVESRPEFSNWRESKRQASEAARAKLDVERGWAKCQRFLRTLENVALAANLPKTASAEAQARYARLQAAEAGFLGTRPGN